MNRNTWTVDDNYEAPPTLSAPEQDIYERPPRSTPTPAPMLTHAEFAADVQPAKPATAETLLSATDPMGSHLSLNSLGQSPEEERPDYVLVYDPDNRGVNDFHENNRKKFKAKMLEEKLAVFEELFDDNGRTLCLIKVRVPFQRLCLEAERTNLQLPLAGLEIDDEEPGCCQAQIDKKFSTDTESDFVSAPFDREKAELFEGYGNKETFFRPALRSLMAHNILINIDIQKKVTQDEIKKRASLHVAEQQEISRGCCGGRKVYTSKMISFQNDTEMQRKKLSSEEDDPNDLISKKGLAYMLMKKSYKKGYIPHEESQVDPTFKKRNISWHAEKVRQTEANPQEWVNVPNGTVLDPRKELNSTWTKFGKFQPMWKIRNYFGEKIAFYFAWSGTLISSLWLPMLFGLGVSIYGFYLSAVRRADGLRTINFNNATALIQQLDDVLLIIKEAFDNEVTPFFGLVICIWGTIFLEVWKRKNATLAYEWDVIDYDHAEPDRPQFVGTQTITDPVTKEEIWHYPLCNRFIKYFCSCATLVFMILLVCASVMSVVAYRVILTVDYCSVNSKQKLSGMQCLFVTTIVSALLNAVSILVLGKIYDIIAYKLTDWENHRTQTAHDNALIIKLFAFQFVNSYSSLFYIAFFRQNEDIFNQGIWGRGDDYKDFCTDNNCMSQLSFQVLILMLAKPFPKLFKDIVLPFVKKIYKKCKCCCCCKNKVEDDVKPDEKVTMTEYLIKEYHKPEVGDFTLGEFTEKVIQYGYLMLFAVAFPLAPLVALLTNLIDLRVDARRLLWLNQRPLANISQDIGMWYQILLFVNVFGVISNAFVIAFTSQWTSGWTTSERLWLVIAFEHFVFGLAVILSIAIPDVPQHVRLAQRRERYQVTKIMEGTISVPKSPQKHASNTMPSITSETPTGDKTAAGVEAYHLTSEGLRHRSVDKEDLIRTNRLDPIDGETKKKKKRKHKKKSHDESGEYSARDYYSTRDTEEQITYGDPSRDME